MLIFCPAGYNQKLCGIQCDQIGQFLKIFATNFITQVTQMFGDFWAVSKTIAF